MRRPARRPQRLRKPEHLTFRRPLVEQTPAAKPQIEMTQPKATKAVHAGKLGNVNALKHGVTAYLAIGKLPKGASYIRRNLGKFRRTAEQCVVDVFGEISLHKGALIQSACRHEARAQLLTRWLRDHEPTLEELRVTLAEIGRATDSRDRCLAGLGLTQKRRSELFTFLDASSADSAENAPASPTEPHEPTLREQRQALIQDHEKLNELRAKITD